MPRRSLSAIALLLLGLVALTSVSTVAQPTAPPATTLAARLPATIEGDAVEVAFAEDLQTWLDTLYPGETHPEIDALRGALVAQGVSPADVATVTAWFGPDQGGQILGFRDPGGDAAALQDAIAAVYLIGLGEMERTQRDIGDHTVTFLSEGPLESATYPIALLPDGDALWALTAEDFQLLPALEALLAVAAGTAPGNTATAPPPPAEIGPATWFGTMRGTLTWDKGAYVGTTTAEFRGTWERNDREDISYCMFGPCAAYLPVGEVEWTFESAAPGPPSCRVRKAGSVPAGEVVVPTDQMLYLEPAGSDHLVYWGSGTVFIPPQDCHGWEGISAPSAFFDIPVRGEDDPFADEVPTLRPRCSAVTWRIDVDATELKGSCWGYDESGYEERFDWDLRDVDPE